MKNKVFIILAAILYLTPNYSNAQKQGKTRERVTLEVIHDSSIHNELSKARARFVDEANANKSKRFILMPLAGLAYNMIVGKLVDGAQSEVKKNIAKSEKKYSSQWTASVSKDYFYNGLSMNGPMDPSGMHFGGLKTSRMINYPDGKVDTAFYFSCHIDEESFVEIMKNSRFNLIMDTLYVNLSKTRAKLPKGKKFNLDVEVKIVASWVNELAQYYDNQELGVFTTTIRGIKFDPERPVLMYTGNDLALKGSCFIIPRSYIGYIDEEGIHHHTWGQGEYSMIVSVTENTDNKNIARDFINEYVINVSDKYGSEVKSSYGTIEALSGSPQPQQQKKK